MIECVDILVVSLIIPEARASMWAATGNTVRVFIFLGHVQPMDRCLKNTKVYCALQHISNLGCKKSIMTCFRLGAG